MIDWPKVVRDLEAENARLKKDLADSQRQWVGLTDDEKHLFSSFLDDKPDFEVFEAIEAKLKEKNT